GETRAAIHLAPSTDEVLLGEFRLQPERGLYPLEDTLTNLLHLHCPAPFVAGGRTNIWGVFASLEESLGNTWVPIDREFILYNLIEDWDLRLSYGVPPPAFLSPAGNDSIGAKEIRVPRAPTDHSTNQLTI